VQNRTRGTRSAAALALTVRQMGRNSVRPVPQEPPILVVSETLLRPLRPPPPAVIRPLLPPHGVCSRPFYRRGAPTGVAGWSHTPRPAAGLASSARGTPHSSDERPPPTDTDWRPPATHRPAAAARTTDGRPPRTPPTGGRRARCRWAAAAHTNDGL